ncbi:MAG TPA: hypothetical protein ENH19_02070 [Actinobacteria bacterium]|nr:hypothetical protein [Actinomycetes bacterium]HEX21423.1 hypothetical protein [Actinomycetota bacterium]
MVQAMTEMPPTDYQVEAEKRERQLPLFEGEKVYCLEKKMKAGSAGTLYEPQKDIDKIAKLNDREYFLIAGTVTKVSHAEDKEGVLTRTNEYEIKKAEELPVELVKYVKKELIRFAEEKAAKKCKDRGYHKYERDFQAKDGSSKCAECGKVAPRA